METHSNTTATKSPTKATPTHEVAAGTRLHDLECELSAAMIDAAEAFVRQGLVCQKILAEKAYRDAGYSDFNEYMDERQPCGIKKSHAYRLIAAAEIRTKLLPSFDLQYPQVGDTPVWTEAAIRPLTYKGFTSRDIKRIGNKVATRVKRGEKLTSTLVKSICDDERGVERKKQEREKKKLDDTPTPAGVLFNMGVDLRLWESSLDDVGGEFWTEAEAENRGCIVALAERLEALAAKLRDRRKEAQPKPTKQKMSDDELTLELDDDELTRELEAKLSAGLRDVRANGRSKVVGQKRRAAK